MRASVNLILDYLSATIFNLQSLHGHFRDELATLFRNTNFG